MAEHYWVFPWFSLVAGLVSAIAGALGAGGLSPRSAGRWPIGLLVVWIGASALLFAACLHVGALATVDVVGARGFLLGAATGLAIAWAARSSAQPARMAPLLIGLAVVGVSLGRLWLTHGEITGLICLALGASVAVLCLCLAPALTTADSPSRLAGVAGLLFVVTLVGGVAIGFTKAGALGKMFWADIPLLLGAALGLGAAVASVLPVTARARPVAFAACALVAGALAVVPLSAKVAGSWNLAGLVAMGFVLFALIGPVSGALGAGEEGSAGGHGLLAGLLLLVAGGTVAFAVWAGYGLALFVLGGWLSAAWPLLAARESPRGAARAAQCALLAAFGLGALLLVYRLAVLQEGDIVRSQGPGDIWDLFAICLGALAPWFVAQWNSRQAEAGASLGLTALQWLLAIFVPAVILDDIWRPRTLAGVFLGVALSQVLAGASMAKPIRLAAASLTAVVTALALLDLLPWITQINNPTRGVRVILILLIAGLVALRILWPGRVSRNVPAAQGG